MKNKDTGEFELVVGDKQLLSGFFIGVVLLAVVFALGYVLGRSTPKSAGVIADTAAGLPNSASEGRPQPASPAVPPSSEPAASTASASNADGSEPRADSVVEKPPLPTTVPARDTAATPKPTPAAPAEPANASYWQVTASSRNSADAVLQTLKDKGFPASIRPGPNNLMLVWVGPYTDKDSLTKAKKALEDAGFPTMIKHP